MARKEGSTVPGRAVPARRSAFRYEKVGRASGSHYRLGSISRTLVFAGSSGTGALRCGASRLTSRSGDEGAALSLAGTRATPASSGPVIEKMDEP